MSSALCSAFRLATAGKKVGGYNVCWLELLYQDAQPDGRWQRMAGPWGRDRVGAEAEIAAAEFVMQPGLPRHDDHNYRDGSGPKDGGGSA